MLNRSTLGTCLVLWSLSASTLLAQGTPRASLQGVWKVADILVTGAGAYAAPAPQPGVFIFAKNHYSLIWIAGSTPRTLFKGQVPTSEEKVAAFDSLAASAGTYEVNGSTVTFRFLVARSPNAAFIDEEFSIEGNTLTLTWVSSNGHVRLGQEVVKSTLPVSTTRMKLTRVE